MSESRYGPRMIVFMAIVLGCSPQSATEEDLGVASESLSQEQRNELTCIAMSLATPGLSAAERQQFRRGCSLYHNETFGGNDRTCSTCHLNLVGNGNPDDNNFDLSIEDVEVAFATDPTGPLFRSIDADDGAHDFTRLRTQANVRIPIELHPNVTVVAEDVWGDDGTGTLVSDDGRTVILPRSTPTSENVSFFEQEGGLMWDGRFDHLASQATEAVRAHFEPHLPGARLPTAQEEADIAMFQRNVFSNEFLRSYANGGPPPELPTVPAWRTGAYWNSVRRGRNFFVDMPISSDNPVRGGHCAGCHSGPMLNQTNEFNPTQPPGEFISNNFVSELNRGLLGFPARPVELRLPEHTFEIVLDHWVVMPDVPIAASPLFPPPGTPLFPPGMVFTLTSPDPGRILTTGDPCELPSSCLINCPPPIPGQPPSVCSTTSFFRTSTLWGAADSGPYFHDNSALTIRDAMERYVALFTITAVGMNGIGLDGDPFMITPDEVDDIVNYFDFAFRHRPVLVP